MIILRNVVHDDVDLEGESRERNQDLETRNETLPSEEKGDLLTEVLPESRH